jgi:hypothetical protein
MQNCAALSWSARKSCRAKIEPLEKKRKRQIFILFRIATGSISLGTGQKGQSTRKWSKTRLPQKPRPGSFPSTNFYIAEKIKVDTIQEKIAAHSNQQKWSRRTLWQRQPNQMRFRCSPDMFIVWKYIKTRVLLGGTLKVLAQVQVGHTWRISNVCTKIFGGTFQGLARNSKIQKIKVYRTDRSAYVSSLRFSTTVFVWKMKREMVAI